jgi:hypothetical protein
LQNTSSEHLQKIQNKDFSIFERIWEPTSAHVQALNLKLLDQVPTKSKGPEGQGLYRLHRRPQEGLGARKATSPLTDRRNAP